MATRSNITGIIRGDTITINISATGIDLTGYTIFFTIKRTYNSSDSNDSSAVIKKTWVSAGATTSTVISAAESKIPPMTYKYDVQYKDLNGNIVTLAYGDFEIINEVTNRTTA